MKGGRYVDRYQTGPHALFPDRPNLRHLKDQAKDLLKAGAAASLADAQFQIARLYGFASWPKLKAHVESFEEIGQLKQAIDTNDIARVETMMTRNPALHRAPLGYGKDGPLTWVAECRVPWEPPSPVRLAMAEWMITHGSDVHQGGDGPLMRAALNAYRIPMMELLVSHGANVNALWHGHFPIIFAPCESMDPGRSEMASRSRRKSESVATMGTRVASHPYPGTALDYLIAGYARSLERLSACIDVLLMAGGETRYDTPAVLAVLRGRLDDLAELIDAEPGLVNQTFLRTRLRPDRRTSPLATGRNAFACGCGIRQRCSRRSASRPRGRRQCPRNGR